MSEDQKKDRSVQDCQNDYQNMCLKAGHLQYQIFTLKKDLELVNESLRDVNLEAAGIKAKEAAQNEQKAEEQSK